MTLALIPESAPFNSEQRAWLNGFLAGWLGVQDAPGTMNGGPTSLAELPTGAAGAEPRANGTVEDFPWHDPALPLAERLETGRGTAARTTVDGFDGAARLRILRLPLPVLRRSHRPRRGDEPDPVLSRRLGDLEGPQADHQGASRRHSDGQREPESSGYVRERFGLEEVGERRPGGRVTTSSVSGAESSAAST